VDERIFRPTQETELEATHGLASDDFVIGFVGRFVAEKGLLTLFKALGKITDRKWKLLLLGRGPLKEQLTQQAETLGIGDRILWIESVPHADVPRYINLMDTLVLPSETTYQFKTLSAVGWKEQFGHVIIEAMACKVPVVGSDSGEIPHVIKEDGLVFPEGNAEAFAKQLAVLIDEPAQQQALAEKGYCRAMAEYTNAALAKRQLNFYKALF